MSDQNDTPKLQQIKKLEGELYRERRTRRSEVRAVLLHHMDCHCGAWKSEEELVMHTGLDPDTVKELLQELAACNAICTKDDRWSQWCIDGLYGGARDCHLSPSSTPYW